MKRHIALLYINKNLRILTLIQLICYFGAWFSYTGIFTLLINLGAPVWAISLSAAMAFIPSVILAPFSGIIIDRFQAYPLLFWFLVVECVSVLLLLLVDSMSYFWFLQVLIFIRMGLAGMYFQVEMSLLAKILNKTHLKLANEIHSVVWAVSYTSGMGLAGIYIHYFGVKSSFVADFVLYALGVYMLTKLRLPQIIKQKGQKALAMLKDGLNYLLNNKLLLHLIFIHAFVGFTSYDALIALLADYKYKEILSVSLIIGFMNMSRAISLVFGPMILSKFTDKRTLFYLFLLQAFGIIAWAFLQDIFYLGLFGMMLAGFATSTLWSYTYTLIQIHCDERYYGRVIAYLDMVYLGIAASISGVIGYLFDLGFSTRVITIFMGSLFIIGAFYYRAIYRRYLSS